MHKILVVFVLAGLAVPPAMASEQSEVVARVHQFVDGFNKGDTTTALAACADEAFIIDDFPPYEWHGTGACSTWMKAFDADATKNRITDGVVTLAKPRHVDISADHAYVVIPATFKYKAKGKLVNETGSVLTATLHKGDGGWQITAWAWAKH